MVKQQLANTSGVLSLFDILLRSFIEANAVNDSVFSAFEDRLKKFFAQDRNSEIRLYFGYSGNFGHKANTVNIMNRLITYFPSDKARTIRIIYDTYASYEENTAQNKLDFSVELPILIPGLTQTIILDATPYKLTDLITLQFNSYNSKPDVNTFDPALPTTGCTFSISGGFDEAKNICSTINVEYLLTLSPYQFTKFGALNTIYSSTMDPANVDGILLGPKYDNTGLVIEDGKVGYYGTTYTKRAFYLPDPIEPTEQLWDFYEALDKTRYEYVRPVYNKIKSLSDSGTIQVMPLYYSQGRILCEDKELLLNMTSGLFEMKRLNTENGKTNICSFVVVFGGIDDDELDAFNTLIATDDRSLPNLNTFIAGKRSLYNERYQFLKGDATPDEIGTAVGQVGPNGIIIFRLGRVPLFLNSYMTTILAGLPAIFEGEGSASMILNVGKPFLHLVSSDVLDAEDAETATTTNQLYPTIPLSAAASAVANACHQSSLGMVQTFDQWEATLAKPEQANPNVVVGSFIYESYLDDSDKFNYFATMRPFFNEQIQDKLMLALMYTLGEIPAP